MCQSPCKRVIGKIEKEKTTEEEKQEAKEQEEKMKKKEKKQKERKDKKETENLSRFFTDVTRKKENIKRKKSELKKWVRTKGKQKHAEEQESKLFFRLLNVDGLNKKKAGYHKGRIPE